MKNRCRSLTRSLQRSYLQFTTKTLQVHLLFTYFPGFLLSILSTSTPSTSSTLSQSCSLFPLMAFSLIHIPTLTLRIGSAQSNSTDFSTLSFSPLSFLPRAESTSSSSPCLSSPLTLSSVTQLPVFLVVLRSKEDLKSGRDWFCDLQL